MICYAIKRDDGRYLSDTGFFETDELCQAKLFYSIGEAEYSCFGNDVVIVAVEIREVEDEN